MTVDLDHLYQLAIQAAARQSTVGPTSETVEVPYWQLLAFITAVQASITPLR